jgi:amino acid permease
MFGPSIYVLRSIWVGIEFFFAYSWHLLKHILMALVKMGDYEQVKNKPNTQRRFRIILVLILVFPLVFGLS